MKNAFKYIWLISFVLGFMMTLIAILRINIMGKEHKIISSYGDSYVNAFCVCELPFYVFFFSFRLA